MGLPDIEQGWEVVVPAIGTAVPHARRQVTERARALGADEATCRKVALAVSEAITNAVLHAFPDKPGQVHATVDRDAKGLVVVVSDDGDGLVPRSDSPGLGMGLGIIAEVADDLTIDAADGRGTRVRMTFPA